MVDGHTEESWWGHGRYKLSGQGSGCKVSTGIYKPHRDLRIYQAQLHIDDA